MIIRRSLQAVLLSFALVAAGCGGGTKTSGSTSGSTGATAGAGGTSGSTGQATTGSSGSSGTSATTGSGSATGSSGTTGFQSVLAVTPASSNLALGTSEQLHATLVTGDGTTQDVTATAAWTSSDTSVASIDAAGLLRAAAPGSATLTATVNGVSGTAHVTVTAASLTAIQVNAPSAGLAVGTTEPLTATGLFSDGSTQDLTTQVSWSSSDTTIAVVDDASTKGLAGAVSPGQATITATDSASGLSGSTTLVVTAAELQSIDVTPASASIAVGTSQAFRALGHFSDGTTQDLTSQVTWASNDESVATVDATGLAQALAVGGTNISATDGLIIGGAQLTVTFAALVRIDLAPTSLSLAKGTTQQLTATGTFSDGSTQDLTTQLTWTSADPTIASASNAFGSQGAVQGLQVGSTAVTATDASSGVSASANVTVTAATLASIEIQPASASVPVGTTLQLSAIGTYSDGSTVDITSAVTWTSSDSTIASLSNAPGSRGVASGVAIGGPVNVTALDPASGLSASTDLTVSGPVLVRIDVAPGSANLVVGGFAQFTATGTFSDGSTQDLTTSVTWTSSDDQVATFANSGISGDLNAVGPGSAGVTASDQNLTSNTATVTVVAKALVSIAVNPVNVSVPPGTSSQLTATGTYNDGSTQDLTATASWVSSNTANFTVNAGLITNVGTTGSATIYAIVGSISGSAVANGLRSLKVAVEGGGFYTDTIRAYLATQPNIASATVINACDGATLAQYDVVIIYGNMGCFDNAAFTAYVNNGGGLIGTPWDFANNGGVTALPVSRSSGGTVFHTPLAVTATDPSDVLLQGVAFNNGDDVGYEQGGFSLKSGAVSPAQWNDTGSSPIASRWSYGSGRSVYLDVHYITSDCGLAANYAWGKQLMYNAVQWAGKNR